MPIVEQGLTLQELAAEWINFPSFENVKVPAPGALCNDDRLLADISQRGPTRGSWATLVRPSGRAVVIMVEGEDRQEVGQIAQTLASRAIELSA